MRQTVSSAVLQLWGGGDVPLLLEHLVLLHQVSAGALARRPQTNLPQEEMNKPRPLPPLTPHSTPLALSSCQSVSSTNTQTHTHTRPSCFSSCLPENFVDPMFSAWKEQFVPPFFFILFLLFNVPILLIFLYFLFGFFPSESWTDCSRAWLRCRVTVWFCVVTLDFLFCFFFYWSAYYELVSENVLFKCLVTDEH